MTFKRFKQIWDCLITDAPPRAVTPTTLVMEGSSPHTIDALVAASHGDFTAFDEIDHLLKQHDSA